jgi:hypothetical protein
MREHVRGPLRGPARTGLPRAGADRARVRPLPPTAASVQAGHRRDGREVPDGD